MHVHDEFVDIQASLRTRPETLLWRINARSSWAGVLGQWPYFGGS